MHKYGGTSVGSPARIKAIAGRLAALRAAGNDLVVVVSAMGDTTDELLALAGQITATPPRRELDMLLTAGERISMALLSMALNAEDCPAISFTGSQSGIITDGGHGGARIQEIRPVRIREELDRGRVVIVAGFQGVSRAREVTTLGRGGSDTSAVALAVAFGAAECAIYTDVDGVFTADPRYVPAARHIARVDFDTMLEFSSRGAGVINSRAVELARKFRMPLVILNSLREHPGTRVEGDLDVEKTGIVGVTMNERIVAVRIEGLAAAGGTELALLRQLGEMGVDPAALSLDREGHAGSRLSFHVSDAPERSAQLDALATTASAAGGRLERDTELAAVSLVGNGVVRAAGVATRALARLAADQIETAGGQAGTLSLTFLVPRAHAQAAVRLLHDEFVEQEKAAG